MPYAPVAQLDRALASGAKGHRFESCRARQRFQGVAAIKLEVPFFVTWFGQCGRMPYHTGKRDMSQAFTSEVNIDNMFITTLQPRGTEKDCGFVSGYCILGTGPISSLLSSITDLLGMRSNAYSEKAKEAERTALAMMKYEALQRGANAVYGVRISLTEATSGKGMLMVSVSGSAMIVG